MLITNLFFFLLFSKPLVNNSLYLLDKPIVIENNVYEDIDPFIDDLYYQDKKIRSIGKTNLLRIAGQSNLFRKSVTDSLVRVLNDEKLLTYQKEFRYQTWYDAAQLLGELKAIEAVDLLVEHLDYTGDKKDISLNYYPAIEVLAELIPTSIPKIIKVLSEHKNLTIRINAARCLGLIHNEEARIALLKALSLEKNPKVREQIHLELNKWLIVCS